MDFLTVPTTTFSLPYCFFIIGHDRRRILHFNVTYHPTSTWIAQQLRDAFPFEPAAKFLILDHDAEYGTEVPAAIRGMDIAPIRTAIGCPLAERCGGAAGRQLSPRTAGPPYCHIAINPLPLKRLLRSRVTVL